MNKSNIENVPESLNLPFYDLKTFPKRKIKPQNAVIRVREREFFYKSSISEHLARRKFYLSVVPNSTITNIEKPPCYIRKFSPDGCFLIAFSAQQAALEIYEYQSIAAVNHLLEKYNETLPNFCDLTDENEEILSNLRKNLFPSLFKLRHVIRFPSSGSTDQHLNRECSLFSVDSRHVIVGASSFTAEENLITTELHRSNESFTPCPQILYEDYTIYCVDLHNGHVTDSKTFKCDKIYLSHNEGISLYDRTLAILSTQHQTIHLYNLTKDGLLIELRTIGRFLEDDDEITLNAYFSSFHDHLASTSAMASSSAQAAKNLPPPSLPQNFPAPFSAPRSADRRRRETITDPLLNSLKQRLLSFLYRQALNQATPDNENGVYPVRNFYRRFDFFLRLRIWRMQLMDNDHMLLRYATEEVASYRVDASTQNSFFVFFDLSSTNVLAVYENTDPALLELFENFADYFRHGAPPSCQPTHSPFLAMGQFPCSISSSMEARKNHDRYKQSILSARNGGSTETVKRIVAQLPLGAQSFSWSPYLDLELFSYDMKRISSFERPKTCGEYPIKMYGRESSLLKFQLITGLRNRNSSLFANQRSLVAFLFHPYEPFAISIQRNSPREYVVNFHLRNAFDL